MPPPTTQELDRDNMLDMGSSIVSPGATLMFIWRIRNFGLSTTSRKVRADVTRAITRAVAGNADVILVDRPRQTNSRTVGATLKKSFLATSDTVAGISNRLRSIDPFGPLKLTLTHVVPINVGRSGTQPADIITAAQETRSQKKPNPVRAVTTTISRTVGTVTRAVPKIVTGLFKNVTVLAIIALIGFALFQFGPRGRGR